MATDWKAEYLYKTFVSRTRRKSHECYIVNAIWQRLYMQGHEIEPVTQKYVRRPDGSGHKFALIDLFFPALDLAIEIDEAYHKIREEDHQKREQDILRVLFEEKEIEPSKIGKLEQVTANDIGPGKIPKVFLRINTDKPYDKIEEQINDVVEAIKTRIADRKLETVRWINPMEKLSQLRKKGKICTSDHIYFNTIEEICDVISPESKRIRTCFFPLKNTPTPMMLWCPKLALRSKNGDLNPASDSGWVNELMDDGTIREWNADSSKLSTNDPNHWLPRVTFLRVKTALGEEGYRFIGIFERQPEDDVDGTRLYKRTRDSYSWSTADA